MASGERAYKVPVIRAFCRLYLQAMHRQDIEVDLTTS